MLQVSFLREHKEAVVTGLRKRGLKNAVDLLTMVLDLDATRRETQSRLDETLARGNALAREIGELMKTGRQDDAATRKTEASELKLTTAAMKDELGKTEAELEKLLYSIPNVPHPDVPEGSGSNENVKVGEGGTMPRLEPGALAHWDLAKRYDIIDFELGNKITGAGFPVYRGKGARLQRALINFFLDEAEKAGYFEVQPPILINEDSGYGTGQLPDKEGQMYQVGTDNLYLIPTAEVPITNMYRDVVLSEELLPVRNVGYTPCFRREAGSWGAHVRGLNRLHQFDKVEIVQVTRPGESYDALEGMCAYVQSLLEKLELPYRRMLLCGADLGFNAAMTYDMEVYAAAQERWLEVSSISNFETYQANRLKLRSRGSDKKTQLLHTLNGSALALPRIVAALLENNQSKDGINLPRALHGYAGFDRIP